MEFSHIPVLLQPCLDGLNIDPTGIYLDGTAGGAGHSREIAKRLTTGRLISLDQDPDAVAVATERLKGLPAQVVQVNFREAARVLSELGIPAVNGALLDLGVSSPQLDDAARGFSYHADAPLDMRMSQQGPTAADLVNTLDREELTRILRDYGEEPYAWQIAGKIVAARQEKPITTTLQLAEIVAAAVPPAERRKAKNPARRTFQAIRIAVNSELDALNEGLDAIFDCLAPGGRLCVITFHSLEDRLVKNKFRRWAQRCTCPPEQPILTTLQLAEIVAAAVPPAERRKAKNPARRTFQAIRIAVNSELDALNEGLDAIFDCLAPGGRLCVITFHSLEDRLVKNKFRRWAQRCTCPPEQPICTCGGVAKAKLITRKPIEADAAELEANRRSRSAKLRVLEKV